MTPPTQEASISSCPYGLTDYVRDVEAILDRRPAVPQIVKEVSKITKELVQNDDWLAPCHRVSSPDGYLRHLLHKDRCNRFVVLALVWRAGHATPIHDHNCWGVMGILRNCLEEVHYDRLDDGSTAGYAELRESSGIEVHAGSSCYLLPPYREIHRIGNVSEKETISIHIYGRDLAEVNVYDLATKKVSAMRIKYYDPSCAGGTDLDFII